MRRIDVRRALLALALACVAALEARPASAFWPITRDGPAFVDSLNAEKLGKRFEGWKERALHEVPLPAPSDSAPGGPARETPARDSTSGDTMRQALELARQKKQAAPAAASSDSTRGAVPPGASAPVTGALTAPAESLATAAVDTSAAPGDAMQQAIALARKQGSPGSVAKGAAFADSGFTPAFDSKLTSSNDAMHFSSGLGSTFSDPTGVSLNSHLSFSEDISLTQKSDQKMRGIVGGLSAPLTRHGLRFLMSTSNSRLNRTGGTSKNGARTSNTSDDRGARVSLDLSRRLLEGVRLSPSVGRNFTQTDAATVVAAGAGSSQQHNQRSGNSYGIGLTFDRTKWMTLRARTGRATSNDRHTSPNLVGVGTENGTSNTESKGDTASVDITVPRVLGVTQLVVGLRASSSEESYTDASRTASGSLGQIGSFVIETRRNYSRSLNVSGGSKPVQAMYQALRHAGLDLRPLDAIGKRFDLRFTVQAGRDSISYKIRPDGFSDVTRWSFSLDSGFRVWKEEKLQIKYDSSHNDNNQDESRNPINSQTRTEGDHKLYAEITHAFTGSTKLNTYAEIRLTQSFYAHEGPQGLGDQDQLRTRLGLEFDGKIGANASGHVTAYVRTYDQTFIDPRRSSNTSNETEYVVRPSFNWKISDRLSMDQRYGLSSKVLDQIYDEDRSTLDRNHFMTTTMSYALTPRLQLSSEYNYLLQDNGLYDVRNALFSPTARTKKDAIGMGVRYEVLPGGKLSFVSRQDATREHRTTFAEGGNATQVNNLGNIALGLDSKLQMGDLFLDCGMRRNQSFNVSLNRNVFYNVDANLRYQF
jgi:hypothetical protein